MKNKGIALHIIFNLAFISGIILLCNFKSFAQEISFEEIETIKTSSGAIWINNAIVFNSETKLYKAVYPNFLPIQFTEFDGFQGMPQLLRDENKIGIQNNDTIWIIDLVRKGSIKKLPKPTDSVWVVNPFTNEITFYDSNNLWLTFSSKGDAARVKKSPEIFGKNELWINDKIAAIEDGITWIFSPFASPIKWSPDGNRLYFISNETGWSKIFSVDKNGNDKRQETFGEGDDRDFSILKDGTLLFISNRRLNVEWALWMKKPGKKSRLLFGEEGFVKNLVVSHDENWISFLYSNPSSPFEVYVMNLITQKTYQVTVNAPIELLKKAVVSEIVRFTSDSRQIEGLLYKPKLFSDDTKYPAIIRLHGGPSMQDALMWNSLIQFIVSHGFIVMQINYTGSVGYGRNFEEANFYRIGYEDCYDVAAAAEYSRSLSFISRIGVMGSSYGGYLTNLVIGKYPNLFFAAVNWFGISDWHTIFDFKQLNPIVRYFFLNRLGKFDENYELYCTASPITYIDSIRTPLMIVHGTADTVVPIQQSEILYEKMKNLGKEVEFIIYNGEGHGWSKKENRYDAYRRLINWFDQYLK